MKMDQILAAIRTLAHSQGFYGRLYRDIVDMMENDVDSYAELAEQLEAQKFGDMLDMVLYFEC